MLFFIGNALTRVINAYICNPKNIYMEISAFNTKSERLKALLLSVTWLGFIGFSVSIVLTLVPVVGDVSVTEISTSAAYFLFYTLMYGGYVLFLLGLLSLAGIYVINKSKSIYEGRLHDSVYRSGTLRYNKVLRLCKIIVALFGTVFFVSVSFVVADWYSGRLSFGENSSMSLKLSLSAYFVLLLAMAVCVLAVCVSDAVETYRTRRAVQQKHDAEGKYMNSDILINVTSEQYGIIIKMLIEAGRERKSLNAYYKGANRDAVSNVLLALQNREKMVEVNRSNLAAVIEWLESIDGLDAQFSENPDDFFEKFSLPSKLRLRRIATIEEAMESQGL